MGRRKKYLTEEERKAAQRERNRRWKLNNSEKVRESSKRYRENNSEKVKESRKRWRENNSEKVKELRKQWRNKNPDYFKQWSEQNLEYRKQYYKEHKEEIAEYQKHYREDNLDKIIKTQKYYRETHRDKIIEAQKRWRNTPIGRAIKLLGAYQIADKNAKRGDCTLTAQWIVENIFTKPCHYCGKEGWDVIGCDRIDNSKPHTPDNVVPCCYECNCKRSRTPYDEYIKKIRTLP